MADKPTTIYIFRHGESEFNRDRRVSGHSNPPLTEEGERQIHQTKQALQGVAFDEAYSSDLQRAARTAEIIYGQPVHETKRLKNLRERNYGSLEGLPNDVLKEFNQTRLKLPEADSLAHKHVPDMESDGEVTERLMVELESLAKKHPGQTILVGNHGTTIRLILMRLEGKHYKDTPKHNIDNGGYVKLVYEDGKFVIDEVKGYN